MGWDGGRYYVRKVKRAGRVVSQYIGGGKRGEQAAAADAERRAKRQAQAEAWRAAKARWETLDAALAELCQAADGLVRAHLLAAGYHQHDRGEWRKRRDCNNRPNRAGSAGSSTPEAPSAGDGAGARRHSG